MQSARSVRAKENPSSDFNHGEYALSTDQLATEFPPDTAPLPSSVRLQLLRQWHRALFPVLRSTENETVTQAPIGENACSLDKHADLVDLQRSTRTASYGLVSGTIEYKTAV